MDRSIEVDGGKRPITPSSAPKSRSGRLSYSKEEEALNRSALDSEKDRLARKQAREHARQLRMEERLRLQEASSAEDAPGANRTVLERLRAETSTPTQSAATTPASKSLSISSISISSPRTPAMGASSAAPSPMNASTRSTLDASNIGRPGVTTPDDAAVMHELRALEGLDGELEVKYKDSLLNIQKLQEHKVAVGYELEQFKDKSEDMQEDLAEAKAEIRQLKAQLREASAGGGGGSAAAPTANAAPVAAVAATAAAADLAALKEERDSFKTENESLRENVSALERMLQKCQNDLEFKITLLAAAAAGAGGAAEPTTPGDGADDAGSARLKEQVKKLKADKRQLENKEDDLASQVRKLERESRRNEAS